MTLAIVRLDAGIVESVSAHKMDGWQLKPFLAAITLFWVEVFCLCLQVLDFKAHLFDLLHILLNSLCVLSNDLILHFQSVK